MTAVGYRKDVRGVPFARASRAPGSTFAIIIPLATTAIAAHANALPSGTATMAPLLLLQGPILSREHTSRDRYVCGLPTELVLLGGEMAVMTGVHGKNSNLLIPRAGSDVV